MFYEIKNLDIFFENSLNIRLFSLKFLYINNNFAMNLFICLINTISIFIFNFDDKALWLSSKINKQTNSFHLLLHSHSSLSLSLNSIPPLRPPPLRNPPPRKIKQIQIHILYFIHTPLSLSLQSMSSSSSSISPSSSPSIDSTTTVPNTHS